jgi:hypothetical protein
VAAPFGPKVSTSSHAIPRKVGRAGNSFSRTRFTVGSCDQFLGGQAFAAKLAKQAALAHGNAVFAID